MTTQLFETCIGPRIPRPELTRSAPKYLLPTVLLLAAAALLVLSAWQPYWRMTLRAPQYPQGLTVVAYLNHLEGDVAEIDELNHYIGMMRLNDAAQMERQTGFDLIVGMAALLVVAGYIHNRWAALLALPAIIFPAGFLLDMHFWLDYCGHHLDPHAALSRSIKPFTPPVLGLGKVGQFRTVAHAGPGLWLAAGAVGLVLVALWFHRRAYKPLVEARRAKDSPLEDAAT